MSPRKKAAAGTYVRAKEGFVTMLDGEQTQVAAGEIVHKDHALVKGREELFEQWGGPRFDVEQATAAPGEKRGDHKGSDK